MCARRVRAGKPLTHVSTARLGEPGTAKPFAQAQGSCAALRDTAVAGSGTPGIMGYPADTDAPQTNCYLVTGAKKPAYGLYAYYGVAAEDFESAGFGGPDHDFVLATASCPPAPPTRRSSRSTASTTGTPTATRPRTTPPRSPAPR
ncbi:hypothetical protein C3492_18175 [Streptomyces sp. Ru62]|uniref:hypothetical protein n=1 Tax=Streptomyces sp. Ru62 TaxID=2080745 RepID=UPI000CDE0155|nr:hypothetical protein [Streptomyces sp. Ru62]POX62178.1 hypothetical protein C3492_18175 [Streptomyces sp. Ru62]